MEIGQRIKFLRENAKLTQIELAKILKINNSTLSQYENGVRFPSDDIKIEIADYFNVSTDYLLGRTDDKGTPAPEGKGGPNPELWKLIERIPESRMPEVERYLRFQAEPKGKP